MEQMSGLMETDLSENTCRGTDTGTEYTDGQMEEYIMENKNRVKMMATDI